MLAFARDELLEVGAAEELLGDQVAIGLACGRHLVHLVELDLPVLSGCRREVAFVVDLMLVALHVFARRGCPPSFMSTRRTQVWRNELTHALAEEDAAVFELSFECRLAPTIALVLVRSFDDPSSGIILVLLLLPRGEHDRGDLSSSVLDGVRRDSTCRCWFKLLDLTLRCCVSLCLEKLHRYALRKCHGFGRRAGLYLSLLCDPRSQALKLLLLRGN